MKDQEILEALLEVAVALRSNGDIFTRREKQLRKKRVVERGLSLQVALQRALDFLVPRFRDMVAAKKSEKLALLGLYTEVACRPDPKGSLLRVKKNLQKNNPGALELMLQELGRVKGEEDGDVEMEPEQVQVVVEVKVEVVVEVEVEVSTQKVGTLFVIFYPPPP